MTPAVATDTNRLLYHSPLSFLLGREADLIDHVQQRTAALDLDPEVFSVGTEARCRVRRLVWDSAFFGSPMFRLETVESSDGLAGSLAIARTLTDLRTQIAASDPRSYVFCEVPSEDTALLQGLGKAGFVLIETRATYFRDDLRAFAWPRSPVREATADDARHLGEVAARARNQYDRYHADPFFGHELADRYLATYAQRSVEGLADVVLVPAPGDGRPPNAFFTGRVTSRDECPLGLAHNCRMRLGAGHIVLVAVGEERRGWHIQLMAEMTHRFRELALDMAYMTTQSTNRAVIHNSEKLGYRFGRATHILATTAAAPEPTTER